MEYSNKERQYGQRGGQGRGYHGSYKKVKNIDYN
jgi:hypothetical protein